MYGYGEDNIYLNVRAGKDTVSVKVEDDLLFTLLGRIKSNLLIDSYGMTSYNEGKVCSTYEFIEFLTKMAKPKSYSYVQIEDGEEVLHELSESEVIEKVIYNQMLTYHTFNNLSNLLKDSRNGVISTKITPHHESVLKSLYKSYQDLYRIIEKIEDFLGISQSLNQQIQYGLKSSIVERLKVFRVKSVVIDSRIIEYNRLLQSITDELLHLINNATEINNEQIIVDLTAINRASKFKR